MKSRSQRALAAAVAAEVSLGPDSGSWADLGVSEATGRMYRREVDAFGCWCVENGLVAVPATPRTVLRYLEALAGKGMSAATIERVRAAISVGHDVAFALARERGEDVPLNPTRDILIRAALRRFRRARVKPEPGKRRRQSQKRAKREIRLDALDALVQAALEQGGLIGLRDAAVLTVGWWGLLRRSEIVALQADDLRMVRGGAEILLRQSKTDQEGRGSVVTLIRRRGDPLCPVGALVRWLDASGIESGPIFRAVTRYGTISPEPLSAQSVRLIVLRAADASGTTKTLRVSAHGLRSGGATELAAAGGDIREVAAKGRWSSLSVASRYVRLGASVARDPMRKIRR